MPYADPEKKRQYMAERLRKKYRKDRKFRHAESDRKAEWLKNEEARKKNAEATARYRAKKKAEREAAMKAPASFAGPPSDSASL